MQWTVTAREDAGGKRSGYAPDGYLEGGAGMWRGETEGMPVEKKINRMTEPVELM